MSPRRRDEPDLDELIADITVDGYDEDAQLAAFEKESVDADFPCPSRVVGEAMLRAGQRHVRDQV